MFIQHPSQILNSLFRDKPYQGADPAKATFLFIGLDANYEAQIEANPILEKLQEYHKDGVAFWRSHQVHHPFLLPQYSGDGRFYHRSFARIGFRPEQASQVAFMELLHVPTVGRSSLVPADLDDDHLSKLSKVVLEGAAQHIFVPPGVARLMHAKEREVQKDLFPWLAKRRLGQFGPLDILYLQQTKIAYSHLHFAVYGRFEARKVSEAAAIRSLLNLTKFFDSIGFKPHASTVNSWDSFNEAGDVMMQLWSEPGQGLRDHAVPGAHLRANCYDIKEWGESGYTVPVEYAGRRRAIAAIEAGARGFAAISAPPNGERGSWSWAKHADLKRVLPILALERTTDGGVFVILGAPILSTEIKVPGRALAKQACSTPADSSRTP